MSYIAFLDENSIVTRVIQSPDDAVDWCPIWSNRYKCECVATCKEGSIRHKYAVPGDTYYSDIDCFVEPAPYPSWVLNKAVPAWEPPVPMPADSDEFVYAWDEESTSWENLGPVASEPFFDLTEGEA